MIIDHRDVNRIKTFGLAASGLFISRDLLANKAENSTFDLWSLIIMIGIWLSLFLLIFLKERADFIKTDKLKNFTSTCVGLVIIVINISLYFYQS